MKPATEPEKLNHLAGGKDGVGAGGGWVQPGVLEGKRDSSDFEKEEETIKRKQKTGREKEGNEKELKLTGSSSSIPLEIPDSD